MSQFIYLGRFDQVPSLMGREMLAIKANELNCNPFFPPHLLKENVPFKGTWEEKNLGIFNSTELLLERKICRAESSSFVSSCKERGKYKISLLSFSFPCHQTIGLQKMTLELLKLTKRNPAKCNNYNAEILICS